MGFLQAKTKKQNIIKINKLFEKLRRLDLVKLLQSCRNWLCYLIFTWISNTTWFEGRFFIGERTPFSANIDNTITNNQTTFRADHITCSVIFNQWRVWMCITHDLVRIVFSVCGKKWKKNTNVWVKIGSGWKFGAKKMDHFKWLNINVYNYRELRLAMLILCCFVSGAILT